METNYQRFLALLIEHDKKDNATNYDLRTSHKS